MDDQVTLEAYADENRALIHNARNDEAIAICKHILHYYPKHVETYRQLGEAYLEKGELDSAKEMFRRVLSADPENVDACVGLASVFELQQLMDEAVWHLERAYEFAPDNFDIQKELIHLYAEAGKPQPRLRMTRGALARTYTQAGLHAQAIQEFRAIIAESSTRVDARVALAETLWRAGRIRDAADVAQALLTPLPFCLKANLILGTAWKESGLPEGDPYLNRAQELDPTNQVAQRLLGSRSPLASARVTVPRYVEGAEPPPEIPSVQAGEIAPEAAESFFEETPAAPSEAPTQTATPESADLFGGTKIAETPPEIAPAMEGEATPKPDLPISNLPPWLLSEFPEAPKPVKELQAAEEAPLVAPETEPLPAWLEGGGEATGAAEATQEISETAETHAEEIPDWLRRLKAKPEFEEKAAPDLPEAIAPADEFVVPDFLTQTSEQEIADQAAPPAEQAAVESPSGVAAEMPPAPAPIVSTPSIVVEMPTAAEPPEPVAKPKRKRQPKDYAHLVLAREHRDARRIEDALAEYDYLVQHAPRLVNEVIDDLEGLTAQQEAPLDAHRILGDAYTRADRLAEALQRYQYVLERMPNSEYPNPNL
ncbi:MAG: tetratricopeptide repeat protein [Chloroflexota bacterium]|nr:tetratricopeptide repeat protein [Chloroflexota bacterium]